MTVIAWLTIDFVLHEGSDHHEAWARRADDVKPVANDAQLRDLCKRAHAAAHYNIICSTGAAPKQSAVGDARPDGPALEEVAHAVPRRFHVVVLFGLGGVLSRVRPRRIGSET